MSDEWMDQIIKAKENQEQAEIDMKQKADEEQKEFNAKAPELIGAVEWPGPFREISYSQPIATPSAVRRLLPWIQPRQFAPTQSPPDA